MRPIIQFLFSRLSGPGLRMWAQQSLGPTPFAAMTPVSIPDAGAIDASLIPVAGVVLLVLIVSSVVELYDRSRNREKRIVDQRDGLKVVRQTFAVASARQRQAIDVTPQVRGVVHGAGVSTGLVIANCLHTTCAVLIEEPRPELVEDLVRLIGRLVKEDAPYKHNDARVSDCERGNAAAHLRATLLGHGVAVGITDGELLLVGLQGIVLAEWDGPRPRQMHVQIMGV